ncbi:uncharacterized protein LOC115918209 [Strongylocentrotus purpuratus]|uniref:Uncharacterized protein n=1 Tax=Strongylocentrotus purpuratus TaxID=7668 RepID=A0A7M7MZN0_STRPU|nr:uncharacterized protein LOC115918209 [Strongylocentrotus purpuratus]
MAEKRPPIAKRPVVPRKSSHSPAASPQPCSKPQNNSDDSDDEDEYGYIQPESQSGDLANLIREAGRLPICVKVRSDPEIKNADCKGGDILMIHCTDKEQVVKALGPTGNTLYLPVHSNQLYQMLPLDPRLDGKEYRGTMELVKANPLPQVVRVLIGYCDETDEDDTKEQDDIITIEGVNKGRNDELYVVGKIMGEAQRIRGMEDEAVYTTQIISEHLSLSQVIKHKLPVRVRTVSTGSPSRRRPTELELRLECLIKRERVIATRARDGAVLAFPFSTPLELDGITPHWNTIPSLVMPLYPLVNTSMCMKGLSSVTLPYTAMKAVPQPKKAVFDEWLKSQEGKSYYRLHFLSD